MDLKEATNRIAAQGELVTKIREEVAKVIVGQEKLVDRLILAMTTGGHILLEGVPGLAKTLSVNTLAKALGLEFKRISFTPDLLPADVVGTLVYSPKTGEFTPKKGPVFTNLLLADEINRAPAKVQSALLESMQEKQVTIGDETYRLPQPFLGCYLSDLVSGTAPRFAGYLRKHIIFIAIYALLIASDLIYGGVKVSEWRNKEPDRVWDVVAVQHNHDSWKGGYYTYLHNFNNLRRLTLEAMARTTPDIVIWSETAFIPSVAWHTQYSVEGSGYETTAALVDDFVDFGENLGVPLLTGNPEGTIADPSLPPILEDGSTNRVDYNTVILFDDGETKETYRKQHLVPFTEYFPYEEELPWLYNLLLANDYNWWLQGSEPVVFDSDGIRFSTPICFEDNFGYLSAGFVGAGADVIVNMSNDNWSKKVSAEMQHAAMGAFRSIETRKATVRGTNSGISCLITPDGAIHEKMEPFAMGWHLYHVPVYSHESNADTFYVRHVDLFAHAAVWASYVLLGVGAILKVAGIIRKRK